MGNSRISAGTQYGDYKGNVSVDRKDGKDPLIDFARDNGVDIEKYFLLSATYYNENYNSHVTIIATTIASDYAGVAEYIKSNKEPMPVKQFTIDISLEDYLKYMKRFSFMITFQDALIGQEINIEAN